MQGLRLRELAAELGLALEGDTGVEIRGIAALESAGPDELAFVRSSRFAPQLARSRAGAVIAPPGLDTGGRATLRSAQPALDLARAARRLLPAAGAEPGAHPGAVVEPGARVDPSASLAAGCVVGARARVGARSRLHAHVTLYPDAVVGEDCELHAGCVVGAGCSLGSRVTLQPGVVVGSDGFGYERAQDGSLRKFPQIGRVVIEDDVEIGANSTICRGALGETRIGRGSKLDNLVQVAHNCRIGEHVRIAAQAGIAGSTRIESGAIVMPQAGIADHLCIGAGAYVGPQSGVHRNVADGLQVMGTPERPARRWRRISAALARLPALLRRVRRIERQLGLEPPAAGDRH